MESRQDVSRDMAIGLVAGLAGTAAMTASQALEMRLTGRKPSATPAEAVCKLLGIETRTQEEEQHLALEAHWTYGTAWGLAEPVIAGLRKPLASVVYLLTVWGAGAALLDATGLAPPPTRWSRKSLLTDVGHHLVYVATSTLTGRLLRRVRRRA